MPAPDPEQVKTLIRNSGPRTAIFFEFFYRTGIRVSEAANIKLLHLIQNEGESAIFIDRGKGGHQRIVPVCAELLARIKRLFRGKIYLFETLRGRKYIRQDIYNLMAPVGKQTIGRPVGPHRQRHGCATDLFSSHPDKQIAICEILGWENVQMAATYVHQKIKLKHMPMFTPKPQSKIILTGATKKSNLHLTG